MSRLAAGAESQVVAVISTLGEIGAAVAEEPRLRKSASAGVCSDCRVSCPEGLRGSLALLSSRGGSGLGGGGLDSLGT